MGSHYIQVGKLKVDKDLLDIVCPAAGYSETPPDPALYCPANGYYQGDTWVAPVQYPDPISEQILLLCDDLGQGVYSFYCKATAGNSKCEILASDMSVLSSSETTGSHQGSFPTQGTGTYYILRFSAVSVGENIRDFYRSTYTGYATSYRVLEAKFYTPEILTMANLFNGMPVLKKCVFFTNMNTLNTLQLAFYKTPVDTVIFPPEMTSLTILTSAFAYTTHLKKVDLSGVALTSLSTMTSMCEYSNVEQLTFPSSMPALTTFQYGARECYVLKSLILPDYAPLLSNINWMCNKCYALSGTVTLPAMPSLVNAGGAFYYCSNIQKIIFDNSLAGSSDSCTNFSSVGRECLLLEEFVMPYSLSGCDNFAYMIYNSPNLKKITLSLNLSGLTDIGGTNSLLLGVNATFEEMTTCPNWGTNNLQVTQHSHKLKTFYQPALRVKRVTIGYSSSLPAQLTETEIDWANSDFSHATSPQVIIRAQLDATEINRIFTALPALAKGVDVRYNPGYATCDKSIATAKGWTVL